MNSLKTMIVFLCLILNASAESVQKIPGLNDFWIGKAKFVPVAGPQVFRTPGLGLKDFDSKVMNSSSSIVTVGKRWYTFYREYYYGERPAYCKYDYARSMVSTSDDQGRSWSAGSSVATPRPNSPSECAILDGSGYFDEPEKTWHFVAQCLDRKNIWTLCHYSRKSLDPKGEFVLSENSQHKVNPGQLWNQICVDKRYHKHCALETIPSMPVLHSEGTPQIVEKRGEYFFVTFHGANNPSPHMNRGFRGAALTKDFIHWELPAAPDSAMLLTLRDSDAWNVDWHGKASAGVGAATILKEGSTYYQIYEAMDRNLACVPDQLWGFGIVRAQHLAQSSEWESWPKNPLALTAKRSKCLIQYPILFKSGEGKTYFQFWYVGERIRVGESEQFVPGEDEKFGMYTLELQWKESSKGIPTKLNFSELFRN